MLQVIQIVPQGQVPRAAAKNQFAIDAVCLMAMPKQRHV
jgi:hypothetical protein